MASYPAIVVKSGLVTQIGADTVQVVAIDRTAAGELILGEANATSVSVGKNNATTSIAIGTGTGLTTMSVGTGAVTKTIQLGQGSDTIEIGTPAGAGATIRLNGNVTIRGTEAVVGTTTFQADVNLGDGAGDVITVNGAMGFSGTGTLTSGIPFTTGSKSISIAGTAGSDLTLAAAAGGAGTGGSVFLTPGSGTTASGSVVFGRPGGTGAGDFQLIADTNNGTAEAGIRYNASTNVWEARINAGAWTPISVGSSLPSGSAGQILQYTTSWVAKSTNDLHPVSYEWCPTAGNSQLTFSVHAQDGTSGGGGATTIRGGNGTTNTAGGALTLQGGGTATGTGGAVTLQGGTASGAGTGGAVTIRGGGGSVAQGNVVVGDATTPFVLFGTATSGTGNGVQYDSANQRLQAIGTGSINIDTTNSRFEINGTAVSGTSVTAANFNALFDGSSVTSHVHAYQPVDATLTALAGLTTSANNLILATGADTFSVGQLTDAYVAAANKDGVAGTASLRTLGTGAQQACSGADARLSNARTPTAHATTHQHGGSDEIATATPATNSIPKTGAASTLAIGWIPTGSTSSTVCIGNDSRLSDARTPTSHAASHQNGGTDEIATATPAANAIPKASASSTLAIGWIPTGTTSTTVCIGNDSRLSDARTPTSHGSTHQHGGSDEIATATPGANAIPKAGAGGTLAAGWIPSLSYQPLDATLTAIAGLTTSANNLILATGADTFSVGQLTDVYVAAANKDGVAGTASLRTLGTGAQQAAAGNHTHSYQPLDATLTALAGLTTSAGTLILNTGADTFSAGALTDAYVAAANKDGVAGTASLRTLGTGAQQAAAGNHTHTSAPGTAVTLTTTGLAVKDVAYVSGTNTVSLANSATSSSTAQACGVVTAAGVVQVAGITTVTSLTAVTVGAPVYLSATDGRVTATAPTTGYLVFLGYCTTGNASPGDIQVLLQPARPIAL